MDRRKDFIWATDKEPHAERRKVILKAHPEIKELMRYDPNTKLIALILMLLQIVTAFNLRNHDYLGGQGTAVFWLASYLIGGSINQILLLICHEASHNLCFKSYTANKMFGLFVNLPMVIPFYVLFKFYHTEHHKSQGKDGVDTDIPTNLEAKLLSSTPGKWFFMFFHMWFYALRPVCIKRAPVTSWLIFNYILQINATLLVYQTMGLSSVVYLLASLHFAGSIHPLAFHFIGEHYVFDEKNETYSYYGLLNKISMNVGFHNEHHDFPSVPWSNLPKIYEYAKNDFYSKLPSHSSYSGMLWKFLTTPEVTLFNRVKRQNVKKCN